MAPALLTAVDSTRHVHLIIGSNPLAGARCTKSLEVGAVAKLIAPVDAELHYGLVKRIEEKEVEWIQREFKEEDLKTLGREDVDNVVDCVFVTLGARHSLSKNTPALAKYQYTDRSSQAFRSLLCAAVCVSQSMSPMQPIFPHSHSSLHIRMALYRLVSRPQARAASWLLAFDESSLPHYLTV